jgi:hypothetical protein
MAMKGSTPVAFLQKLFRDRDSMQTTHQTLRQNPLELPFYNFIAMLAPVTPKIG